MADSYAQFTEKINFFDTPDTKKRVQALAAAKAPTSESAVLRDLLSRALPLAEADAGISAE